MASSLEYVEFICDQLSDAGEINYKRMFGEYGIYCEGKYFAAVCDNRFLVKVTDGGKRFMPDCETAPPYDGAKEMFLITELEDREFLKELSQITCSELLLPKPKKKRINK